MINDIEKILYTEDDLKQICKTLGNRISKDYNDSMPIIIGILKGAAPFTVDLCKNITIPCEIDFISVKSYQNNKSTGNVNIKKDIDYDVTGRDIILVEDIVDTGITLKTVTEIFKVRGCKSIEVATLLDKPAGRKTEFNPKYVGASVPNEFIVGYGLDYNELYRNLPFIGILKRKVYER